VRLSLKAESVIQACLPENPRCPTPLLPGAAFLPPRPPISPCLPCLPACLPASCPVHPAGIPDLLQVVVKLTQSLMAERLMFANTLEVRC
jgi:hypothetical protein